MKTWKRVALALGIASVLGGASAAIAANAHRRGDFQQRFTNHVNRMLDKINATDTQRQQINQIVSDTMASLKQQRQAHASDRGYWIQALTADKLDVDALKAKADEHAQAMANTAKTIIIPAVAKVHDILTPAQRQQLADMAKNHAEMRGGFGGPQQ
ncbi:MAG TPA: Spy/CpxP family protein refolding chaperone [Myxococcales bacterium]|jgi:Spy/CpxP family protein refolding chaperone|nr:Spy/CpxP family protein refolding chaperone [Myxococcales bacterium]